MPFQNLKELDAFSPGEAVLHIVRHNVTPVGFTVRYGLLTMPLVSVMAVMEDSRKILGTVVQRRTQKHIRRCRFKPYPFHQRWPRTSIAMPGHRQRAPSPIFVPSRDAHG